MATVTVQEQFDEQVALLGSSDEILKELQKKIAVLPGTTKAEIVIVPPIPFSDLISLLSETRNLETKSSLWESDTKPSKKPYVLFIPKLQKEEGKTPNQLKRPRFHCASLKEGLLWLIFHPDFKDKNILCLKDQNNQYIPTITIDENKILISYILNRVRLETVNILYFLGRSF